MGIETVEYISDLYPFWPFAHDYKKEGSAHIRAIKTALVNSFPTEDLEGLTTGSYVVPLYAKSDGTDWGYSLTTEPSDILLEESSTADSTLEVEGEWVTIDHGTLAELELVEYTQYPRMVHFSGAFITGEGRPGTVQLGVSSGTTGPVVPVLEWKLEPSNGGFFYKTLTGCFLIDWVKLEAGGLIDTGDEVRFFVRGIDLDGLVPGFMRDMTITQESFA